MELVEWDSRLCDEVRAIESHPSWKEKNHRKCFWVAKSR
jgi:hypothetical protein